MIIVNITPQGEPSRLFLWLLRKSLPGISLLITDPYELTLTNMPSAILGMGQIVAPTELKTTREIRIVVNPSGKEQT